jgi:hypothetical protein
MKTRGLTYLNKLVLYGFVLGIVPLLALGFFSYIRTSGTIQDYVVEGNLTNIKAKPVANRAEPEDGGSFRYDYASFPIRGECTFPAARGEIL